MSETSGLRVHGKTLLWKQDANDAWTRMRVDLMEVWHLAVTLLHEPVVGDDKLGISIYYRITMTGHCGTEIDMQTEDLTKVKAIIDAWERCHVNDLHESGQ